MHADWHADWVITTFPCKKGLIFLTSTKYVHSGIKVTLPLERTIRGALNQSTLLLASTLMDR